MRDRIRISKIVMYVLIVFGAIISLFPFYWLAVMATNDSSAFMRYPPVLTFGGQLLTNVKNLFDNVNFGTAMANTFFVAIIKTFGGVFFCSLCAFYFAKFQFPGKKWMFAFCMLTMMIPPQLNMIPQLIIMNKIGWLSTLRALIVPGLVPAFGIYWMNQYCTGAIHDDLLNSARIDGCGTFGLYLHVGLPIIIPGCAFLCIYIFMDSWNDYLWPLIVTSDSRKNTLQVALAQLQGAYNSTDYGMVMCGVLLATLPLFVMFLLFSKQFTADIAAGAIKD
ncbi:MAG: carbohydrate ABC transporter permease [Lachnospiraceae bacterium]|jgi:cellobiose transport system permease protein|nr:carbohydrate ABC transporter permease [Lachnospiraceae bacterium]